MSKWNLINFFSHEHNCFWHHLHQTRSLIIQTIFVISTIFSMCWHILWRKTCQQIKCFFMLSKQVCFENPCFLQNIFHSSDFFVFRLRLRSFNRESRSIAKGKKVLWFVKTPGEWRALNDVFEIGVHPTFCECLAESWSKVSTN